MDRGAWQSIVHRVAESDTTEHTQAGAEKAHKHHLLHLKPSLPALWTSWQVSGTLFYVRMPSSRQTSKVRAAHLHATMGLHTGCLGLVHWDDPEGCYGEEEGGGFRMGPSF